MSTIVYQELQSSCHESYFPESRTLSLKLNSSKLPHPCTNFYQEFNTKQEYIPKSASSSSNSITGGSFSSIEKLSRKKDVKQSVYVHPLVKRSGFTLSERSLQMCTESLGSETGSCDIGTSIFFPPMMVEERQLRQKSETIKVQEKNPLPKHEKIMKKDLIVDHGKFPPPLTTISGSNRMTVKQHRENGRLVLEAVTPPPVHSYMQAERSGGRLKLTLVSDDDFSHDENDDDDIDNVDECTCSFDDQDADSSCCDCQMKTNNNNDNNDDNNNEGFNSILENEEQQKDVEENTEKEELKGFHKSNAYLLEEDISGKKVEFGVKLGFGKIQRSSRCKERGQGNKRLINWEPFWVAI